MKKNASPTHPLLWFPTLPIHTLIVYLLIPCIKHPSFFNSLSDFEEEEFFLFPSSRSLTSFLASIFLRSAKISASKSTVGMPNQSLKASRLLEDQFSIGTFSLEAKPRHDPSSLSFSPTATSIGITPASSNSNEESFSETILRGLLSSPRESTAKTERL